MVNQELVERVTRLPARERLALIEVLTRSLHSDLAPEARAPNITTELSLAEAAAKTAQELAAIEQLAKSLNLDMPADSSLHQLCGIALSVAPMTKAEMRDMIADYLIEKYS
jgi:hypothetical protein